MRKHCIDQQWAAKKKVVQTYNSLVKEQARIDESLYFRIVGRCVKQFGNDFVMLDHCITQQLDAYFALNTQNERNP